MHLLFTYVNTYVNTSNACCKSFIEMQTPPIWLNRFNEQIIILKHYQKSKRYKHMLISEFELTYINLFRITIRPSNTKKVAQTFSPEQLSCNSVWLSAACGNDSQKSWGVSLLSALCKSDLWVHKFLPKLHNCPDSSPDGLYSSWYKTVLIAAGPSNSSWVRYRTSRSFCLYLGLLPL